MSLTPMTHVAVQLSEKALTLKSNCFRTHAHYVKRVNIYSIIAGSFNTRILHWVKIEQNILIDEMRHWDILGIPKDDFQSVGSTGKIRIIRKKSVWYSSSTLNSYNITPSILVFCTKHQKLENSYTRMCYTVSLPLASKPSPRGESPPRELILQQKPQQDVMRFVILCLCALHMPRTYNVDHIGSSDQRHLEKA